MQLAPLPPMTDAELEELHVAVSERRERLEKLIPAPGREDDRDLGRRVGVLWSLATAIAEARLSIRPHVVEGHRPLAGGGR